jgi:SAM-dependent methyltransferase
MERDVYHSMRALQREHWWFVGRRRVLEALFCSLGLPARARILEAGAGSGGNVPLLQRFGEVEAFDMDAEAAAFCREDTGVSCEVGSLPQANPFAGKPRFDLVVALDVIEHIDEDVASLRSLATCLAPGGRVLLTVPAYPWLFSGHDRIHHHKRRYTRRSLERLVREAGLRPHRSGYFNSLLLPMVVMVRMGQKLLQLNEESDARMPGRLANSLLARVFGAESVLVRRIGFPAGVSLFVVASGD